MIQKGIVYNLKQEFFKELNISESQYVRRKDELLDWLKEFYDYELIEGKPLRILIKDIYGEYKSLPRKTYDTQTRLKLSEEKNKDYNLFTIAELGTEWKPNSKRKISRDAILVFAEDKYGHTNVDGVARNYVGPIMDQYGERTKETYWVWYDTYEVIDEEVLNNWRKILEEEHISEKEAANAFYRQEQGEDISEEKNYYKEAQRRFKQKYGSIIVQVPKWKLK